MRFLPLALLLAGGALMLAAGRARAAINPAIPHVPDPRDYFPPIDYSGGYLTPQPETQPVAEEFRDPWEAWGNVNIFDAPAAPSAPVEEFRDPFESWGAVSIFDAPVASVPSVTPSPFQPMNFTQGKPMNPEANLAAFLKMIRTVEANGDYSALVYGGNFKDFSTHPYYNKKEFPPNGWRNSSGSHAAGAYQIQPTTWNEVLKRTPLPDFSPQSQDIAAAVILNFPWRNAYADVTAGRFDIAVRKLAKEWEAFEKILAGTYPYTMDQIRAQYVQAGGVIEGVPV